MESLNRTTLEEVNLILPALEVRMRNNYWPAGKYQPEGYDLEMMKAGLREEHVMFTELADAGLGEWAQRAFNGYCQIHVFCDYRWEPGRAASFIYSIK